MVIFLLFNCLLTVFDEWYTVQSSKTLKTIGVQIVTGLPRLYQQCTNGVPIVKKRSKTVKRQSKQILVYQSSQVYQDCTNSVPIVKNSQNSTKMATGVPVVTWLPRLYQPYTNSDPKTVKRHSKQQKWPLVYQPSQFYQDCTNSVTIVYQELSYRKQIACQLHTQYVESIHRPKYYTVTLKSRLRVTQGHWKRNHGTEHTRLTSSRVIWR